VSAPRSLLSPVLLERTANDIRGPAGLVHFLLDEVAAAGGLAAVRPELIARAQRGVIRLLRIADRLSRAAQLESETLVLARDHFELCPLVHACLEQAQTSELRPEITVTFDCAADAAALRLDGDPSWLSAALVDVVAAAIHRARAIVEVKVWAQPNGPGISIADDGLRSAHPSDIFSDLPFALAGATLARHGFRLDVDDPPPAESGFLHGGRVVLALFAP
jgi:signal transduction histidine kinase